jgi:hypothetical protein
VNSKVESAISETTIAVIRGNKHPIAIAGPACDCDFPGRGNDIVVRIADGGDVCTLADIAVENDLVLPGR